MLAYIVCTMNSPILHIAVIALYYINKNSIVVSASELDDVDVSTVYHCLT